MKALGISEREGLSRFATLQAYYSVAGRDLEREIVPMLRSERMGLLVWSPLAGGLLSGKFKKDGGGPDGSRRSSFDFPPVDPERAWNCIEVMQSIGAKRNVSAARVAIAWLLHQPAVTSVIIGARRIEQLEDNLAATELVLDRQELEAIDKASALPSEYPAWMLERQGEYRKMQLEQGA